MFPQLLNQEARFKVISSNRENDHGSTRYSTSTVVLRHIHSAVVIQMLFCICYDYNPLDPLLTL